MKIIHEQEEPFNKMQELITITQYREQIYIATAITFILYATNKITF